MARRSSWRGAVVAAAVLAGALASPDGRAQPAPDLARAKELYQYAETAMTDGRFDDAARDYGSAYELSRDPVLFFKIGRANERAGRCDVALSYYARYLRDGKPEERFAATTRERIRACGGDARSAAAIEPRPGSAASSAAGEGSGSAGSGSAGSGSAGSGDTGSAASSGSAAAPSTGAGPEGAEPGVGSGLTGQAPAPVVLVPSNRHKVAWILTGGAVALATLGGVLAYAASSSENDVRDLYVGFAGQPATFTAETRKRYDDLVAQGRRFQHLSWGSFGLAGAAAVGAAVLFVVGGRGETAQRARITPIVAPSGAGVAVGF
jgi:hypothetical protein